MVLIIFSAKRTIVDETSKFLVTSKTLKEADKKEHVEKRVMYLRNYFDVFVEGTRNHLYELGLWASTTRKNTEKCVHMISEQVRSGQGNGQEEEEGDEKPVFKFVLDRSHCSNSQGERLGDQAIYYAGPVIKDLSVIWKNKPDKYGPHNTILVTSSITEAILQPRNVIYIPDFDASRKSVDNTLARLHFLLQTCQNPDDPTSVTDARAICDRISRMPGFGFPQLMLLPSSDIITLIKEATPLLLKQFIGPEKLTELGLSQEDETLLDRIAKGDKNQAMQVFADKMEQDVNFRHIVSNFVFNLGYLSYLRVNKFELPKSINRFIDTYETRQSVTYANRTQLTKQNDLVALPVK